MKDASRREVLKPSAEKVGDGSWCERGESNPHGFPHRNLNPARLPVPPLSRTDEGSSGSPHPLSASYGVGVADTSGPTEPDGVGFGEMLNGLLPITRNIWTTF